METLNLYKKLVTRLYNNNRIYKNFVVSMEKTLLAYKESNKEKKHVILKRVAKINNLLRLVDFDKSLKKYKTFKEIFITNQENKQKRQLARFINFLAMNRKFYPKDQKIIQTLGINISIEDKFKENIFFENKGHITLSVEQSTVVNVFNDNLELFIERARNKIFENKNIVYATIKFNYFVYEEGKQIHDKDGNIIQYKINPLNIKHQKEVENLKDLNVENIKIGFDASNLQSKIIGYTIFYFTNIKIQENELKSLIAYSPSSNRKFHENTTVSTSTNKLCIYESFLHISNIKSLCYMRKNKETHEEIKKMLNNEGEEIEKAVKDGKLIESLELLTKKYNNKIYIVYYNIKDDIAICVDKGITKEITKSEIKIGEDILLYELNRHVAPSKYSVKLNYTQKMQVSNDRFVLKPHKIKKIEKIDNILGFDTETYKDEEDNCHVFNITLYGQINNKTISKSFYGDKCINNFVEYIDKISTKKNYVKSRPKKAIKNIYIYGFNNSRFDNLLIYLYLYEKNPATNYIFSGNSIKAIEYNNIKIYDLNLYYAGSLSKVAEDFKLEIHKSVFPYKYPNKNNINDKVPNYVPELEYWNSEEDRNEYIKNEGYTFDIKEYTEKYCLLDSKLVYEIAKKHIAMAQGEINISQGDINIKYKFNCIDSPTSANMALKIYRQVFLNKELEQSPDHIIEHEKESYKGGRTEVFKKSFETKDGKKLNYIDINSAHPSGMLKMMPDKYINSIKFKVEKTLKEDEIIDYHNYYVSSKYIGSNKYVIPNLLIKKDGSNMSALETPYGWHWGIEIKEAIKNNFEIKCKEIDCYLGKEIFKEFSTYFYGERLKIKKTNEVLATFYKAILNSLYGKFGQRTFTKSALCNNMIEVGQLLKSNYNLLRNIENIDGKIIIEYNEIGDEYNSIGKLMRFSSYISATTRVKLSEAMRNVGHENVYYCDTDSIFTTGALLEEFISNTILGKWKVETGTINKAIFLAPKSYMYIDDKEECHKAKGLKASKIKGSEYDLLHTNGKDIKQTNTMFLRSLMGVKIIEQERTLTTVYNKREWIGNDSIPFKTI